MAAERPLLAAATDLEACPRPTALPRAHRRSSVAAGTQLTRGANSWAARIARLRRPYGPASDYLGPCRLPTCGHFASPGEVQNSETDDTNPGGDQESMEWEEIDDDTSLLVQLQNWSIAEDLSMECDTTENTELVPNRWTDGLQHTIVTPVFRPRIDIIILSRPGSGARAVARGPCRLVWR
ncbi:hypothetical protein J6590_064285 [Homalodisca vitripennis]|nr:hypothetical protein J6590_064285 [Homalodisca vitripennis]